MKKGPSFYYASDKNVFDALSQSKVDRDTIQGMFRRRNVVCSKQTKREELSRFFSRLTHDLLDHMDLSARLGVVPRRERMTAVDLVGQPPTTDTIQRSIDILKTMLGAQGDVVNVNNDGKSISLHIKYSVIDYKKSEFSQLQHRSGIIEVIQEDGRLVLRSTKSDYLDSAKDELIRQIEAETDHELTRQEISLFHHPSPTTRSQFFYDLMIGLPGYSRKDVSDVFVFKPRPERSDEVEEDDSEDASEPHIERILLRGVGVSQSDLLRDLTREKAYYIAKVGWVATASLGAGAGFGYDIEATFSDPKNCTGFSYILRGVFDIGENGKLAKKRRSPTRNEIDTIAKAIEGKARSLMAQLDTDATGE